MNVDQDLVDVGAIEPGDQVRFDDGIIDQSVVISSEGVVDPWDHTLEVTFPVSDLVKWLSRSNDQIVPDSAVLKMSFREREHLVGLVLHHPRYQDKGRDDEATA